MDSQLIQTIRTKIEAKDLITRLIEIKDGLNRTTDFDELLDHNLNADQKKLLVADLDSHHVLNANRPSLNILIDEILLALEKLPVFTLEIAFHPNLKFTRQLIGKLSSSLREQALLDIKVNADIIGGAVIQFQGRRFDYSLVKKFDS